MMSIDPRLRSQYRGVRTVHTLDKHYQRKSYGKCYARNDSNDQHAKDRQNGQVVFAVTHQFETPEFLDVDQADAGNDDNRSQHCEGKILKERCKE